MRIILDLTLSTGNEKNVAIALELRATKDFMKLFEAFYGKVCFTEEYNTKI